MNSPAQRYSPARLVAAFNAEFNGRPQRERLIILAVIPGVLAYLLFIFLLEPVRAENRSLERQLIAANTRIQLEQERAEEVRRLNAGGSEQRYTEQLRSISARQQQLSEQLDRLAGDLVSPQDMTRLLTAVLEQQDGLTFIRMENKERELLRSESPETTTDSALDDSTVFYSHSLVIEFEGDYLGTLRYLLYLESLSQKFYWDSIHFKQLDWPVAHVTLEIHTLSSHEGFIGV